MVKTFDSDREKEILEHARAMHRRAEKRIAIQQAMQAVYDLTFSDETLAKSNWSVRVKNTQPTDSVDWLTEVMSARQIPDLKFIIPEEQADTESKSAPDEMPMGEGVMGGEMESAPMQGEMMGDEMMPPESMPVPMIESESPKSREEMQDDLEQIFKTILRQNDLRRGSGAMRAMAKYGVMKDQVAIVCADLRLSELWKGNAPEFGGKSPFAIEPVDPESVFVERDSFGVCVGLRRSVRPMREVIGLYGERVEGLLEIGKTIGDTNGNVVLCEYWTRNEWACWVEKTTDIGEPFYADVKPEKKVWLKHPTANPLGFVPIVLRTCRGEGDDIRPMLLAGYQSNVFVANDLLLTAKVTEAHKYAMTQYVKEGVPNPTNEPMALDYTESHIYELQPGQTIKPVAPPINPEVDRTVQLLTTRAQVTTVPPVIAGSEPGGVTAASGINLLVHGAQVRIEPYLAALKETYQEICQMILGYIRSYQNVNEAEYEIKLMTHGRALEIRPEDLPEYIDVDVKIEPDMPQDRIAMANVAMMLTTRQGKDPIISDTTAREWIGIQDDNRERELIQKQKDEAEAQALAEQMSGKGQVASDQVPPELAALMAGGQPQGQPPGMMPQAIAPQTTAGMPIENNPQPGLSPDSGTDLAQMLMNANRGL